MSRSLKSRKTSSRSQPGFQEFSLAEVQPYLQPATVDNFPVHVLSISQDKRRVYKDTHQAAPTSPVKKKLAHLSQPDPTRALDLAQRNVGFDFDVDVENMGGPSWLVEDGGEKKSRKRRYLSSVSDNETRD